MAEKIEFAVTARESKGTGACGTIRNEGFVPGVFYKGNEEHVLIQAPHVPLEKLYGKVGKSHLLTLMIEKDGKVEERPCFIKQLQRHPFKNQILHVDFLGVDLDKKVRVLLPLKYTGKSKGVELGGKLKVFRERVVVECLPTEIPQFIEVDITELVAGANMTVNKIPTPENISIVYDQNFAIIGVSQPKGGAES